MIHTDPTGLREAEGANITENDEYEREHGITSPEYTPPSSSPNSPNSPDSPGGSGDSNKDPNKDKNDPSSTNKTKKDDARDEKDMRLAMAQYIVGERLKSLGEQLKNSDPKSEQYKSTKKEFEETLSLYRAITNKIEGKGDNPSKQRVIDYIRNKCKEIGLPEQIGLAIAWTETQMNQFDKKGNPIAGKNKDKDGKVVSTDRGLMQINDYAHKGTFDFDQIKTVWKYNVDAGLKIALDDYKAAVKAGETDIARATYSAYNAGPKNMDRYRTENDPRDKNFATYFENSPWN